MLRFRSRVYFVNRDIIQALPFGMGSLTLTYFRILNELAKSLRSRRKVQPYAPSRGSATGPS
jgi:hypothetical protein